ncbi:MAG: hypothetical protein LBP59_10145 [Planctomycetaceae bacterium]|nr:hypothetical protein [Planctomycetaceae bacterium]
MLQKIVNRIADVYETFGNGYGPHFLLQKIVPLVPQKTPIRNSLKISVNCYQ